MSEHEFGCVVIVLNGISKNFFYPGARVGYIAVHGAESKTRKLVFELNKKATERLSANGEAQLGAYAAYSMSKSAYDGYITPYIGELRARRDIVANGLNAIPNVKLVKPEGAFYAYFQVEGGIIKNDLKFAKKLIKKGVFVVPGSGFELDPWGTFFRLVFLPGEKVLRESIEIIGEFMSNF
ncbi:MAG TPA: aminotransferase class I/II-fold pyridoxal phosphate-dependent enzyme [Candidatus Micrarchaeota archaeon]|nr:aminotransferase class I/II-fold pyridoxal phosphate-dependent enzyme [Candidatus Micrarchaeota archaeon]